MDHIEVTRVIPSAPDAVRELFWAIGEWTRIWDRLTRIDVGYDDGVHQEVTMTVTRDGRLERVRTARFRVDGDIAFFSPEPPPAMDSHRGAWAFAPDRAGCRVTARREYCLLPDSEHGSASNACHRAEYRARFESRLASILECFARHFAAAEVHA
jgi:hypothetical protein